LRYRENQGFRKADEIRDLRFGRRVQQQKQIGADREGIFTQKPFVAGRLL